MTVELTATITDGFEAVENKISEVKKGMERVEGKVDTIVNRLEILGASRRPPTPNFRVFRGFRSVFRVFRGRGWSGRVREPIFMPGHRFFIIKSSFEKVKKSSFYTIEKWS